MRAVLLAGLMVVVSGCTIGLPGGPGSQLEPPPDGKLGTVEVPLEFVHEHATFALFILGERVLFNHTDYDLRAIRNQTAHLHVAEQHGGSVIHIEGGFPNATPDITLQVFFRIHGVRFEPGALALDTRDGHNGSLWVDTEEHRWRVWAQPRNDTWTERPEGPRLLLRDGMRVLVTHGRLDPQQLEEEMAAVPPPP